MAAIMRILCVLSLATVFSSCGGGGGAPAPVISPPSNQAPTANAGADQSADEGTTVDLSATGSDSDGTIASYSWQQESGAAVTVTNADMASASFVAPAVVASEDLVFKVTVTDDDGATGTDLVTITVNDTDPPPPPPPPPTGDFIPLGDLPGGDFQSVASDVSGDGSVVVGWGTNASGADGYRWTAATGMVSLDPSGELEVTVYGVSADGTVVVGWKRKAGTSDLVKAFRWTAATGVVEIDDLPGGGTESYATAASADGSVVVGRGSGASGREAFRWTSATGTVGLGDLPGASFWSVANAVSADGSVVVGGGNSDSAAEAFRWTSASGMVGLGDLPGGEFPIHSGAGDVSADGSVVVGMSEGASGTEAILWTSAGGMMGLGFLPGHNPPDASSSAFGVSADGSVVVGRGESDNGSQSREAFVWTQANGMQRLSDILIAKGVTGLDNWELHDAASISADGLWVVGYGINPSGFWEAYVANISVP